MLTSIIMAAEQPKKDTTWFTGEVQHEGFPLLLRFPKKPDFDTLQIQYPRLVIVTHQLEKVKPSGLPEADYNDSLEDMDQDIITSFPAGIAVLVETFGGRRTYYIYTTASATVEEAKRKIATKYPKARLEWKASDDPNWRLIRGYSEDYHFYKKG